MYTHTHLTHHLVDTICIYATLLKVQEIMMYGAQEGISCPACLLRARVQPSERRREERREKKSRGRKGRGVDGRGEKGRGEERGGEGQMGRGEEERGGEGKESRLCQPPTYYPYTWK